MNSSDWYSKHQSEQDHPAPDKELRLQPLFSDELFHKAVSGLQPEDFPLQVCDFKRQRFSRDRAKEAASLAEE